MVMSSSTEKILRTRLKQLLRRPDNANCADCRREGPKWASFSLGLFLCMQCASIHRSMGTHISKVRSVSLDRWNKKSVQLMCNVGNTKANEFWEANLDPSDLIDERASDADRDRFIRTKYELRKYVRKKKKQNKKRAEKKATQATSSSHSRFDDAPRPRRRKSRGYHSSEEVEADLVPETSKRSGRRMHEASPWVKAPGASRKTDSNTPRPPTHPNRPTRSQKMRRADTPSQVFSAPTSPTGRRGSGDGSERESGSGSSLDGDSDADGATDMFSGMMVTSDDATGGDSAGDTDSSAVANGHLKQGTASDVAAPSGDPIPDLLNFGQVTPSAQAPPEPVNADTSSLSFLNSIISGSPPQSQQAAGAGAPPQQFQSSLDFIANAQQRQLPQQVQQQQQQQLQQQQLQQQQNAFGVLQYQQQPQFQHQQQAQFQPQPVSQFLPQSQPQYQPQPQPQYQPQPQFLLQAQSQPQPQQSSDQTQPQQQVAPPQGASGFGLQGTAPPQQQFPDMQNQPAVESSGFSFIAGQAPSSSEDDPFSHIGADGSAAAAGDGGAPPQRHTGEPAVEDVSPVAAESAFASLLSMSEPQQQASVPALGQEFSQNSGDDLQTFSQSHDPADKSELHKLNQNPFSEDPVMGHTSATTTDSFEAPSDAGGGGFGFISSTASSEVSGGGSGSALETAAGGGGGQQNVVGNGESTNSQFSFLGGQIGGGTAEQPQVAGQLQVAVVEVAGQPQGVAVQNGQTQDLEVDSSDGPSAFSFMN